jgi:hypothetical protein
MPLSVREWACLGCGVVDDRRRSSRLNLLSVSRLAERSAAKVLGIEVPAARRCTLARPFDPLQSMVACRRPRNVRSAGQFRRLRRLPDCTWRNAAPHDDLAVNLVPFRY